MDSGELVGESGEGRVRCAQPTVALKLSFYSVHAALRCIAAFKLGTSFEYGST